MNLKKAVSSLVMVSLALSLAACGGKGDTNSPDAGNKADTSKSEEKVVLKYANWNLGTDADKERNIERYMIEAFEETHKNITIEIDESITGDWTAALSTAASAKKLPDVFMLNNISSSVANDWLLDISDIQGKDEEYNKLPQAVQDATKANDGMYAIPFAQHMMGYFVNKDIFNNLNLDVPEYGIGVDEFIQAIKDTTDVDNGIVGIDSAQSLIEWYPSAKKSDMGWFTFADGKYQLDSPEMIEGVATAKNLGANKYAYEGLTDQQKKALGGKDGGAVFRAGKMAFYWNGTWMLNSMVNDTNFDWDFIGLPSGKSALVTDFLGIAKTTKHPEAAYEFAKWMSYSKEGFMKRISIGQEKGIELNGLPLMTDQEALDAYWEVVNVPGIVKAYENMESPLLDPIKIVPGYAGSRWEAETGLKIGDKDNAKIGDVIFSSVYGNTNYQDYAKQINDLAQQKYDEALQAMKK